MHRRGEDPETWIQRVYKTLPLNFLPDGFVVEHDKIVINTISDDKLIRLVVQQYVRTYSTKIWRDVFFPPDDARWNEFDSDQKMSLDVWLDFLPVTPRVEHYVRSRISHVLKAIIIASPVVTEVIEEKFVQAGFGAVHVRPPRYPPFPDFIPYDDSDSRYTSEPKRQRVDLPLLAPVPRGDTGPPPRARVLYNDDNWTTHEAALQTSQKKRARTHTFKYEQRKQPRTWEDAILDRDITAMTMPHRQELADAIRNYANKYGHVGPRSSADLQRELKLALETGDDEFLDVFRTFIEMNIQAILAAIGDGRTAEVDDPFNVEQEEEDLPDYGVMLNYAALNPDPLINLPYVRATDDEVIEYAKMYGHIGPASSEQEQTALEIAVEDGDDAFFGQMLTYIMSGIRAINTVVAAAEEEEEEGLPPLDAIFAAAGAYAGGHVGPVLTRREVEDYGMQYGGVNANSAVEDQNAFVQMVQTADEDELERMQAFMATGIQALLAMTAEY